MIGAAVDVGSNSVHLLVARVDDAGLHPLIDQSELIGLGDVVASIGHIPRDSVDVLIHALTDYRDLARDLGAESVTFLGTEPLRRATNAAEVAAEVQRETGIALRILNRTEEGELTFVGVTQGRPVTQALLVADIGGGSTEVVLFDPSTGLTASDAPVGSARLWRELIENDPPTDSEIARLRRAAAAAFENLPRGSAVRAVFVGGTATNIVKLAPLAADAFDTIYQILRAEPAAEIAERYAVRLRRAHQLAPGAAIAEALMRHYDLATADVSDASLRDGAILEALAGLS